MTRMAAGPDIMDIEDWMPSKIYLNVPLMWDILQFNCVNGSAQGVTTGLLNESLTPSVALDDVEDGSTLEIVVATSPEISINTADGGQEAPTLSFRTTGPVMRESPWNNYRDEECLTFNFTPWLYADSSQFLHNGGDIGYDEPQSSLGENRNAAWWEGDNFSNIMFNSF
jgi:hypothetical protein